MAAGEYLSVSSQADAERADLSVERRELTEDPAGERDELAAIYRSRGLSPALAEQVADELSAGDVLSVHARDELGMTELSHARPFQAAGASAASFTVGAALPLLAVILSPAGIRITLTVAATLVALDRRIAEQGARRALAKAMKVPDMTASGAITYDAQPEFRVGWRASGGITLPIFTRHTAGVLLEDAELTRLKADRDATLATTEGAVAAALARASAAREQMVRFDNEILPNLIRSEQMVQDGYSAGQTRLFELLAALQQTRESRLKGLQAALDFQIAMADLERAVGTRLR
jgi:outer membrane protein TolC